MFYVLLVYVFIGENWALLDFIDIMNDRNLLSTGEYVVLAIDNSIDDVSDNQVKSHSNNTSHSGQAGVNFINVKCAHFCTNVILAAFF